MQMRCREGARAPSREAVAWSHHRKNDRRELCERSGTELALQCVANSTSGRTRPVQVSTVGPASAPITARCPGMGLRATFFSVLLALGFAAPVAAETPPSAPIGLSVG